MNLNKQFYIYSVDTGAFYNEDELNLHNELNKIALERIEQKQNPENSDAQTKHGRSVRYKAVKEKLYASFKANRKTRTLNISFLKPSNIVSMFDSNSSRTFGIEQNELTTDLFIIRAYFFDIVKDIMANGFYHNGEKYIYFTSSAGQIRTKKMVFIRESLWLKCEKSIMCGLSADKINQRGGVNVNKFLAYLALCNGATEDISAAIPKFDLRKTVVVNDFETLVSGEVDYIDSQDYTIERKTMDVPITHTDGCGMVLPKIHKKSFMVRLPWIKGLLSPFAFDEFCRARGCTGDIVDIYGNQFNIFKDDIQIILTKSQFKMWKYYDSWQDYIQNFISNHCQGGICNEDEDYIKNAKFNYQMLQTLSDMNDDELKTITEKSRTDIINIASDTKTMLKVFGAIKYNKNKTYLQQALEIYPEMLSDNYCKHILKLIKRKLVKNGLSGKFEVDGKYTFLIPDLYAFCERLFEGIETPNGLLGDGEIYCNLYPASKELDCLRSPHLYMEHGVRRNTANSMNQKWFLTNGIYTSSRDLISKLLQFDNDGDKGLICADQTIIDAAKRNIKRLDIVPLYYEMGTAKPVELNSDNLYAGLIFAFSHCNIGAVSNDITKIWNGDDIKLDIIKLLCCENNFIIDAAKTLTKPERPEQMKDYMRRDTNVKLPHFFIYANDKEKHQVQPHNNSVVNRLKGFIPNKRITFAGNGLSEFNYKMLMKDESAQVDDEIVSAYLSLQIDNHFNLRYDDKHSNLFHVYEDNRRKMLEICSDATRVVDVLVKHLYEVKKSDKKEALWYSFGDVLLDNLKRNINIQFGSNSILCEACLKRIPRKSNRHKYCDTCLKERQKESNKLSMRLARQRQPLLTQNFCEADRVKVGD